jgi:serine phosphatase RsbU (regulator of sigma subunit)
MDTAGILWNLDQRLANMFNVNEGGQTAKSSKIKDGCDLAVLFIANDGSVRISSGHIHVFVCDGRDVTQIKGQRIFIGEGNLRSKDDVDVVKLPPDPDNKFYVASDGLFDQIGGERFEPYGYKEFKEIIMNFHSEPQSVISGKVWEAFEAYRGAEARIDDFELITFKP